MSCRDIQEKLSALLDSRLEEAEKATVVRHLQECQACRHYYESLVQIQAGGKEALSFKTPPEYWQALPDRIMAAIPAAAASRSRRRPRPAMRWLWRGLAYASALGLLAGVTVVTYQSAENRGLYPFAAVDSATTPARRDKSITETAIVDEQKADTAPAGRDLERPVAGLAAPPAAAPAREKRAAANQEPMPAGRQEQTSEGTFADEHKEIAKKRPALSRPTPVAAATLSKSAVSVQDLESPNATAGGGRYHSLSALTLDNRQRLTGYLQTLQTSADGSFPQRPQMIVQAAVLFHTLAVEDTLRSLRPSALAFYQQHEKVLIDSLGEQTMRQWMSAFLLNSRE